MRTAARLAKRLRRLPRCPTHVARSETTVADSGEIMLPPLASHPVVPRGSVLLHSTRFPLPLALPLFPLFITKPEYKIFQPHLQRSLVHWRVHSLGRSFQQQQDRNHHKENNSQHVKVIDKGHHGRLPPDRAVDHAVRL